MVQNVPKDIQIFRYLQLVVRSGELTEKQLTSPMISDFKYHYADQGASECTQLWWVNHKRTKMKKCSCHLGQRILVKNVAYD